MTICKTAGPAVHLVFPRFNDPDFVPHDMDLQDVKHILVNLKIQRSPKLKPVFLASILTCWKYIKELVDLSDGFLFEPTLSGLSHDLRLYHRERIYVIEIKTIYMPARQNFKIKVTKGVKQVKAGMAYVNQHMQPRHPVQGNVLIFIIYEDGREPEIIWKDVHLNQPPPA